MPTVRIADHLKLAFSFDTNPLRSLGKYLQNPASINLRNLPARLDEMPFGSLDAGLEFDTPVGLGTDAAELTISGGISGGLRIFVPEGSNNDLFDSQHYGEPVEVAPDEAYVGVSLIASAGAAVAAGAGDISFGCDAGSEVRLTSYTRLSTKPQVPRLVEALRAAFEDFVIPGDLNDLEEMPNGAIATVDGSGKLRFAASANLLAVANPIASVNVPVAGALKLDAGATVTVAASLELSSEYQIRVEKLAAGKVRLGYYKKQGSDFTVTASAAAGIAGRLRNTDLIGAILGAVSSDPLNAEELKNAGLSEAQIDAIGEALREGVNNKLEIAASAQFGRQSSREAAFLFDIDLNALEAAGRSAVHDALDGNLLALTNTDALPAGLTVRRSLLTQLRTGTEVLRLNIFGIYDLLSVTRILSEGVVVNDPVTGLSILDKATATRVQATIGRFDRERLRRLLADFFLITAAYRGSRLAVAAPELSSAHTYAELQAKTNRQTMKDNLEIAEALGLLTAAEKDSALDGISDFGRTIVVAEVEYGPALCRRMFLNEDGSPRTEDDYDRAGLEALGLLVQPDDPDAFRRRPVTDDSLWRRMTELGQFSMRQLFPDLDAVRLELIVGDYTLIRWWSKTMSDTAAILAQIDGLPVLDPEDNRFRKLRSSLARQLRSVAENTKPRWSDPWGLIAVDVLTARAAEASIRITGPKVNVTRERASGRQTPARVQARHA